MNAYKQMLAYKDEIQKNDLWKQGLWWDVRTIQQMKSFISNFHINIQGMLEPHVSDGVYLDSPWVFIPYISNDMHCRIWRKMYDCFGFNPAYCLTECYKVVIKLPTVEALFHCQQFLTKLCDKYGYESKCGVDVRDYTTTNYAGFVYCKGQEKGQEVYENVIKHLPSKPGVSVVLKKGCTEMEALKPSNEWEIPTDNRLKFEAMLMSTFSKFPEGGKQSDWMINRIWHLWLMRAKEIGDETWQNVIGREGLSRLVSIGDGFVNSITYHKEV